MRTIPALCLSAACICLTSVESHAQTVRTIRVNGEGVASASPNQVTIRGNLSANKESIEKSAAAHAEVKEAFAKAIEAGEYKEVRVEFKGEKVSTGAGAMGVDAAFAVPGDFDVPIEEGIVGGYLISEEVVLRIAISSDMEREGIVKKLGGLVETASKAGLTLGAAPNAIVAAMGMEMSSSVTQFELDEEGTRELRAEAYVAAMKDARSRAAALASLSGGRLGKVISIEETASPEKEASDMESLQMAMLSRMFGGAVEDSQGGIDHNGQIELKQKLIVTFELVD